jgi:hypothetical protein
MRLRHTILALALAASVSAEAFELIMIQAVSESRKTFITRNGKRQGVETGMTATFTAEDVSVLARAVSVTGNFTQWQLLNIDAVLPFEKGAIVTYYPATEYIWALAPEAERRKYIKTEIRKSRPSLVFKGALTRGISETVSDAPANTPRRGGYHAEVFYERDLVGNFAWDAGLRYEREVINYSGASLLTMRNLAMVNLLYYFDYLRDYVAGGRIYLSGGIGYGLSNTTTVGLSQAGPVSMIPSIKLGISLPFNDTWEFVLDNAFESLSTREEQEDGNIQTTTQTNYKVGFGLRRFF